MKKQLFAPLIIILLLLSCESKKGISIKLGDSIFVKDPSYFQVYKKGDIIYYKEEWEKKKLKDGGISKNSLINFGTIKEKDFYIQSKSFLGICKGFDSSGTERRKKYYIKIAEPKRFKIDKDYQSNKIENLDKNFIYVEYDKISNINNDSIFR